MGLLRCWNSWALKVPSRTKYSMILWHNEHEFEQHCWTEGNHDHPAASVTLNTLVHCVFTECEVWDRLVQVIHQVTSFCCANRSELASFLPRKPMETQGRGALPAHPCLYMAKQYIKFFVISGPQLHPFLSPLYKWTGQWLQYFTCTLPPVLQIPDYKQVLTQHAGEHRCHASMGLTASLCSAAVLHFMG